MDHSLKTKLPHWSPVTDDGAVRLRLELEREISTGHPLEGVVVTALAHGPQHPDDILFRIESEPPAYAVVHLTWVREKNSDFPRTKLYQNLDDVAADEIEDPE